MVAHGHSWVAHCIRDDRGKSQLNRNDIAVIKAGVCRDHNQSVTRWGLESIIRMVRRALRASLKRFA
jgi:hypothetical protein